MAENKSLNLGYQEWPSDWCPECSTSVFKVYHGAVPCEKDPTLPANVIEKHFQRRSPDYVGINWKAISNNAVRALEDAGYKIVAPNTNYTRFTYATTVCREDVTKINQVIVDIFYAGVRGGVIDAYNWSDRILKILRLRS